MASAWSLVRFWPVRAASTVATRNKRIQLRPERDGTTTVVSVKPVRFPVGTRVEIVFGPALDCDANTLDWAKEASYFAQMGKTYTGKTSPHWYDVPHFHELLSASDVLVRELVAQLDGCTGGKAGEIAADAGLQRTLCKDVTRQQAAHLLKMARLNAKPVQPKRLGAVGAERLPDCAYAVTRGTVSFGAHEPKAEIPFVVEAWAKPRDGKTYLSAV
jgi:hypothetical protein